MTVMTGRREALLDKRRAPGERARARTSAAETHLRHHDLDEDQGPLRADLRTAAGRLRQVLRARPGDRAAGGHRRGDGHHRGAVDRRAGNAAYDANVPHRRRRGQVPDRRCQRQVEAAGNLRELHQDIQTGLVKFEEAEGSERERVRSIQAVLKVLEDQVSGLLRVVELFEARKPKGQAIVTEHAGVIAAIESKGLRNVVIHTPQLLNEALAHQGLGTDAISAEDILDESGEPIVKAGEQLTDKALQARSSRWASRASCSASPTWFLTAATWKWSRGRRCSRATD